MNVKKLVSYMSVNSLLGIMASVLMAGCAPTGNWNDDTIFFSPPLARQSLEAKRAEIDSIRANTERCRMETAYLERKVAEASSVKRVSEKELDALRQDLTVLEEQLAKDNQKLEAMHAGNTELASRVQEIENDIAARRLKISRLRAQLALAMSTR